MVLVSSVSNPGRWANCNLRLRQLCSLHRMLEQPGQTDHFVACGVGPQPGAEILFCYVASHKTIFFALVCSIGSNHLTLDVHRSRWAGERRSLVGRDRSSGGQVCVLRLIAEEQGEGPAPRLFPPSNRQESLIEVFYQILKDSAMNLQKLATETFAPFRVLSFVLKRRLVPSANPIS